MRKPTVNCLVAILLCAGLITTANAKKHSNKGGDATVGSVAGVVAAATIYGATQSDDGGISDLAVSPEALSKKGMTRAEGEKAVDDINKKWNKDMDDQKKAQDDAAKKAQDEDDQDEPEDGEYDDFVNPVKEVPRPSEIEGRQSAPTDFPDQATAEQTISDDDDDINSVSGEVDDDYDQVHLENNANSGFSRATEYEPNKATVSNTEYNSTLSPGNEGDKAAQSGDETVNSTDENLYEINIDSQPVKGRIKFADKPTVKEYNPDDPMDIGEASDGKIANTDINQDYFNDEGLNPSEVSERETIAQPKASGSEYHGSDDLSNNSISTDSNASKADTDLMKGIRNTNGNNAASEDAGAVDGDTAEGIELAAKTKGVSTDANGNPVAAVNQDENNAEETVESGEREAALNAADDAGDPVAGSIVTAQANASTESGSGGSSNSSGSDTDQELEGMGEDDAGDIMSNPEDFGE